MCLLKNSYGKLLVTGTINGIHTEMPMKLAASNSLSMFDDFFKFIVDNGHSPVKIYDLDRTSPRSNYYPAFYMCARCYATDRNPIILTACTSGKYESELPTTDVNIVAEPYIRHQITDAGQQVTNQQVTNQQYKHYNFIKVGEYKSLDNLFKRLQRTKLDPTYNPSFKYPRINAQMSAIVNRCRRLLFKLK